MHRPCRLKDKTSYNGVTSNISGIKCLLSLNNVNIAFTKTISGTQFFFPQFFVSTIFCFHNYLLPQLFVSTILLLHKSLFSQLFVWKVKANEYLWKRRFVWTKNYVNDQLCKRINIDTKTSHLLLQITFSFPFHEY